MMKYLKPGRLHVHDRVRLKGGSPIPPQDGREDLRQEALTLRVRSLTLAATVREV